MMRCQLASTTARSRARRGKGSKPRWWRASYGRLPEPGRLLVETFLHEGQTDLVAYGFAGRNAMQTLGLLLTKQMEDAVLNALGFVATDYAVMIWGLEDVSDPARLFDLATRREGLGTWSGLLSI